MADASTSKPSHPSLPAGALDGLRVLDIATFIAAPFCGTILGDLGAEVIKVEMPGAGDSLRKYGTQTECGDSLVWMSESRNKQTITLDFRKPEGAALFKKLVAESDIVLENFRPGTLEKWGIGYEALKAVNPKLIMLRISAYGQTGPKRHDPGFARIAHAFGGLSYLSGEADGPPVVPGSTSVADYASGMWGAIGVLAAVRARDNQGIGQFIDLGLYESVFRLLDEIVPAYAKFGYVRERMGADTHAVVPHSHYQTGSGEWVALACTSDKMFERLANVMGKPELAQTYPTSAIRVEHRHTVNGLVADWVGSRSLTDVLKETGNGEVMTVQDERIGELVLPSPVLKMSETPTVFKHAGRALGADNERVYGELLGLSADQVRQYIDAGVL